MNVLTEEDALREAQLLEVRFDAVHMTVGVLFELRTALQLRQANTGVLVARRTRRLVWSVPSQRSRRFAWNIINSSPRYRGALFSLSLGMWPDATLEVDAESAAFYVGDVPGLDRIPDYVDDDEATVRAQLAGWESPFRPVHAVYFAPES